MSNIYISNNSVYYIKINFKIIANITKMLNKSLRETPKELKGKVKYNVSSKIDTGIRKDDELYSNYISPDGTDRGRLTTAVNSRGNFSPVRVLNLIIYF